MLIEQPTLQPDSLLVGAFEAARPGMALVARDGQFLRVNPSLCQIVGYPEAELRKLTFQKITHPDDLAPDLEKVEQLIRGEISGYQMEKRYFRKDGSIAWVQLDVSAVRDRSGAPICFSSQMQDLTQHKAEEVSLTKELMRQLFEDQPNGDLLHSESGIRLLRTVRLLSHQPSLLGQSFSALVLDKLLTAPVRENRPGTKALLTKREQEILALLREGRTSKEIGRRLAISFRTVEAHRASMTRKIKLGFSALSDPRAQAGRPLGA